MPNHVHLLAEVNSCPLGSFMKMIQQKYTQYFNSKYGTYGHVFQGRYKALLVKAEAYFLKLVCYIHQNPLRAGLESTFGTYSWTGHNEIKKRKPYIVDIPRLFDFLDSDHAIAKRQYFTMVGDVVTLDNADSLYIREPEKKTELPPGNSVSGFDINDLLIIVSESLRVSPYDIQRGLKSRNIVRARNLFIYLARHYLKIPGNKVAAFLAVSPEHIARTYQAHLLEQTADIKILLGMIEGRLYTNRNTSIRSISQT